MAFFKNNNLLLLNHFKSCRIHAKTYTGECEIFFGGSEFLVFPHCDPHTYLVNSTDTREKSFQYTKLSQSVSNCKLGGLKKTYTLTSKIDPVEKLREIKNVPT